MLCILSILNLRNKMLLVSKGNIFSTQIVTVNSVMMGKFYA